jgi:uncharacterized protein (TIGR02145 family)
MKKVSLILSAAFTLTSLMLLTSCEGTYKEVKIGDQVWMSKNLNVENFRNGDPIPHAKTGEEWRKAVKNGDPAWCYYKNDPANGEKYGKLYNWYAVNDPRGLAPQGWRIPSDEDWTTLIDHLGEDVAGTKMKSTSGWYENENGTNESGFSGLPGGYRERNNEFKYIGEYGFWWMVLKEYRSYDVHSFYLAYHLDFVALDANDKGQGLSVRCLRD